MTIKIYKALNRLLRGAQRKSRRLELGSRCNWNEFSQIAQSVNPNDKNNNPYPNSFYEEKTTTNGSCFFDSFRQSLEQQKGIKVTISQLRKECEIFASSNPPQWFKDAISNSYDNMGKKSNENIKQYTKNILSNNRWGDPEVEGRILCKQYGIKLHVVENHVVDGQQLFLHQLIDNTGSKSVGVDKVNYNDNNVAHIINSGNLHFQPLLDKNKNVTMRKRQQEKEDFELATKLQREEYDLLARQSQKQKKSLALTTKPPLAKKPQRKKYNAFQQIEINGIIRAYNELQ
ncbi:MAG: hypothetical protein QWI36_04350 [Wolbachia endosymbiont of Tyrophagus putrescentiae]|nr:hypothetical protein [Wolbachia endosymbiont of Tyrophagus putrescentiae]